MADIKPIIALSISTLIVIIVAYFITPLICQGISKITGNPRYDWQKVPRIPMEMVKRVDKGFYGHWAGTKELSSGYFREYCIFIDGKKGVAYKQVDSIHKGHFKYNPILYAENEVEIVIWFVCYTK